MTDKQIQSTGTAEIVAGAAPGAGPRHRPIGLSEYFDRSGVLWIVLCVALAVGAGHLIPRLNGLLRSPTQSERQRLDLSRTQAPAVPGATPSNVVSNAISGQPAGAAISATGPQKVW
jgi:hypothetical protein